jgi:hypothetical protein
MLVEHVVCACPQVFHIRPHKHLSQLANIAVQGVVNFDDTPRIRAPADDAAVGSTHPAVRPDNSEGDRLRDFLRLGDTLLVLVVVGRSLEDADLVECQIGKNLIEMSGRAQGGQCVSTHPFFKFRYLLLGHGVRFGNDGNQVHTVVQLPHEVDIDLLQSGDIGGRFQVTENKKERRTSGPSVE